MCISQQWLQWKLLAKNIRIFPANFVGIKCYKFHGKIFGSIKMDFFMFLAILANIISLSDNLKLDSFEEIFNNDFNFRTWLLNGLSNHWILSAVHCTLDSFSNPSNVFIAIDAYPIRNEPLKRFNVTISSDKFRWQVNPQMRGRNVFCQWLGIFTGMQELKSNILQVVRMKS